jgi:peptidoglycan/xylan/chitin deacetylase (PgdA/CDA1 family)
VHVLDPRYNFRFRRHGVSSVSAHTSLAKRAQRLIARTVGVPLGSAAVLLLRLTARKAGVALMYHSVAEQAGDPTRELVPPHHVQLFERQVRLVRRLYEVVPAERLLDAAAARRRWQRFPAAITFDDDLACHATVALPVLRELGVTATFFLSGASLERPFAFHYERLQRAFDTGVPDVPSLVFGDTARSGARGIHELSLALERMPPDERDAAAARLGQALGPDPEDAGIRAEQVRTLADAGMTIGFHTRRHDSLAWLDDERLERALVDGRSELEAIVGRALTTIGYPHGRADVRVADAARTAGYKAGFTTQHVPVTPESDRLLQGRVGPSLRSVGALAIELAVTLVKRGSGQPTPAPEPPAA